MVVYHGGGFRGARSVSAHRVKSLYHDGKPVDRASTFSLTRTKMFVLLALVLIAASLRIDILVRLAGGSPRNPSSPLPLSLSFFFSFVSVWCMSLK